MKIFFKQKEQYQKNFASEFNDAKICCTILIDNIFPVELKILQFFFIH